MWNEVKVAGLLFIAFWPLVVLAILIAGRRWPRADFCGQDAGAVEAFYHCADRPRT